jgi:hypothetical protein
MKPNGGFSYDDGVAEGHALNVLQHAEIVKLIEPVGWCALSVISRAVPHPAFGHLLPLEETGEGVWNISPLAFFEVG